MVVPLPGPGEVKLTRPDAAEVTATACGIASVVAPAGGLTDLQRMLLEALFPAMTEQRVDLSDYEPMSVDELAEVLRPRNLAFRTRGVQVAVLAALVLRPLPADVAARVGVLAHTLGVDEGMVEVAQRFAEGSLGLAAVDFERNGYTAEWHPDDRHELHTSHELASAWDLAIHDPPLAERWAALGSLPAATLGHGVWRLYRARGFAFPGLPGSAPPLLAQHDWVHVLGDYGTRVESEVEVFALIARANDDMRAFSLLAMVVSLFETGYLRTGAGLFQSDAGHLSGHSAGHAMSLRLADAMRRGAWCRDRETRSDSVDFLRQDWFALAPLPLEEVRARFNLRPKSPEAMGAGSSGPWAPGGISAFQLKAGRAMAAAEGREYASYGASPD
ncbi:MAG TPA: hypothetical protein VIZ67_00150 [Acidimicrobiales bacterium]